MLTLIIILLALIAIYCIGSWLFLAFRAWRVHFNLGGLPPTDAEVDFFDVTERYTFHLGLCGTLALTGLGLIAVIGAV